MAVENVLKTSRVMSPGLERDPGCRLTTQDAACRVGFCLLCSFKKLE
jgi:hypothetical protein